MPGKVSDGAAEKALRLGAPVFTRSGDPEGVYRCLTGQSSELRYHSGPLRLFPATAHRERGFSALFGSEIAKIFTSRVQTLVLSSFDSFLQIGGGVE
jgi:hypothetical protein